MSHNNAEALYFSLDKSSDPLIVFGIFGTKALNGSFSASATTATITVTDSLSEKQVSQFKDCLSALDGPLFHLRELIYNIKAEQLPGFFSLITKDIPQVASQDINFVNHNASIHAYIAARRVAGIMTQTTTMKLDADCDKLSLKPYHEQLLATTVVEIRPPKAPRTFSVKLVEFIMDMESVLKDFFPKAKSLILFLGSSSYTQCMMQILEHLEALELVYSATASSNTKDLQLSVIQSLPYLVNLRELTVPGNMMSYEVFFALGDLKNLQRLTVTGMMPLWGRLHQTISQKFLALETMDLNCYLDNFLALPYLMKPVPRLRSLVIRIPSLRCPMDQNGWPRISRVFPNVESLSLIVRSLDPDEQRVWFTLENVACFTNIKQLAIQHPRPLEVSDDIMMGMLAAWPRLVRLSLNSKPSYLPWKFDDHCSSVLPTWNIIEYIRRNKLPLRSLSLYLGSLSDIPDVFEESLNKDVNENLERLTIGTPDALPSRTLEYLQFVFKKANIINAAFTGSLSTV